MTFDDVSGDGSLWAVRYDGEGRNILEITFDRWNDPDWLREFFKINSRDLLSYFRITSISQAIYDTIVDAQKLECVILDSIASDALDLDGFYDLTNKTI